MSVSKSKKRLFLSVFKRENRRVPSVVKRKKCWFSSVLKRKERRFVSFLIVSEGNRHYPHNLSTIPTKRTVISSSHKKTRDRQNGQKRTLLGSVLSLCLNTGFCYLAYYYLRTHLLSFRPAAMIGWWKGRIRTMKMSEFETPKISHRQSLIISIVSVTVHTLMVHLALFCVSWRFSGQTII